MSTKEFLEGNPRKAAMEMLKLKHECAEIHKLKTMLEKAHTPFEWHERHEGEGEYRVLYMYQIIYPRDGENSEYRVCSVVEGFGSYGYDDDRLEIMGLCGGEKKDVLGWLTAEDVFGRIKAHWETNRQEV